MSWGVGVAATSSAIGTFDPLAGSPTAYTSTMRLDATGFPAATMTSTSRAGQVGPQSGASTWFGADSPPGQLFGSSQNLAYLNLRPRVDTTTPSVTTYTWQRQTPLGWGFVLGDIDADEVRVSAVTADGDAATTAELGFRGTFNLCTASPRPSGCSTAQAKDQPTWAPPVLRGNAAAADTYGASGWFVPTVPLRSLTFTFAGRSGAPVFQTWFGVVRRDVSGTVTGAGACTGAARTVRLLDATGAEVARTTTDGGGAYAFTRVPATTGWRVELGPLPSDCLPVGPRSRPIDTSTTDATADLEIREVVPAAIGGRVVDEAGDGLAGVTVTIDGPGGPRDTTTDADGGYLFDENQPGTYTLTIERPSGFEAPTQPDPVTVPAGDDSAITIDPVVLVAEDVPPPPTPSPTPPVGELPDPPATQPDDLLPDTGGAQVIGLVLAGLALVVGLALLRASRRK